MGAQDLERRVRQRHEAVFGALTAMHVNHHSLTVDIADFQMQRFLQAQAAGVDRAQESVVMSGAHAPEQRAYFFATQDRGQARFALRAQDVEQMPVALQDMNEEEADSAVADAHGVRRPVIDVLAVQEVILELALADLVRALAIELAQHAHRAGVGFLGALALAVEREQVDGFLIPVCHHGNSPQWGM
jgi:hypothetical protein